MKNGQFPAILPLASLNGQNGFKIDGEAFNSYSGASVSAGGDINGDGYDDLLIAANNFNNATSRNYVVFGGPNIGHSGLISLSNLNGSNGFKLDGEMLGDASPPGDGYSINGAGDINGDHISDLLIGAYNHNISTGRSYLVFGGSKVGINGSLPLFSLNGINGFKVDGEVLDDQSGVLVSASDDVNMDGYIDLLIGANGYRGGTGYGRSYVVFGGPNIGSSGILVLSNLNGTNGFKMNGEEGGDFSGSYGATGDINGDGVADLVIGAHGYPAGTYQGRSYVIFGGIGIGGNGNISLSSLNGSTGFKVDGEKAGSLSGWSVKTADINGDYVDDLLIGSPWCNNHTGSSYVVFGGQMLETMAFSP